MKVAHYLSHFSLPSETFIYDLLLRQAASPEFDPYVVTHYRCNEDARPFPQVTQVRYELPLFSRLLNKLSGNHVGKRTARALRKGEPDLVHCHFAINAVKLLELVGAREFATYRIAVSAHGSDVLSLPITLAGYREKLHHVVTLPNVHMIANSRFLQAEIMDLRPCNPVEILYNTFHPDFEQTRATPFREGKSRLNIISVGRLIRWKGHIFLIKALQQLRNQGYEAFLTLVGDGGERDALQTYVTDQGLEDAVHFAGSVNHRDIPGMLTEQDIYVQPSIYDASTGQTETFGVAVLEAVAAGLPVIVTRTGGLPELIGNPEPPYAYLVEPESEAAIAQALTDFCHRRRKASREVLEKRNEALLNTFSNQNQLDNLYRIYENIRTSHP